MNKTVNFMLCEFYINKKQKLGWILMEASKEGSAVPANAGSQRALAISHLSGLVVSKATSFSGFIAACIAFSKSLVHSHILG